MAWRDFFYFSREERRAFIVLLSLIVIAGILLILKDFRSPPESAEVTPADSVVVAPQTSAHTQPSSPSPSEKAPPKTSPNYTRKTGKPSESVSERVNRLTSSSRPSYPRTEKLDAGVVVELNAADTTILKKVPGIGSSFASRIIKYRELLGGYYDVNQLSEVYGIDEEKYNALAPWFTADASLIRKLPVNMLPQDSLRRHPYLDYRQAKAIEQLRRQKKSLSGWENLQLLSEFTDNDKKRLLPYLSFETGQ
jgi:DNA uptake protein ComE-like DNA-binding protein